VDVVHSGIERVPANSLDADSDLGDILVTVAVAALPEGPRRAALLSGVDRARRLLSRGIIQGALLSIGDQAATVGNLAEEVLGEKLPDEGHLL
ncbi:MAG: hypothetical protein HOK30_15175, partial [Rhodospirillaceae bacterium]|nr:hypothetical protein [Rhodospirillaceae bacterium]